MINTNYIFETLFKNIDKGKAQLLNLQPGQIVQGNLLEILDGNQALISIQGNKVLAKLEVPLSKGQQSLFMVTSVTDEVKLKLISDNNQSGQSSNSLKDILQFLNLKNTATNREIIESFVQNRLPVDKSTVENFAKLTTDGYNLDNLLTATKILNNKKLPLNLENIKGIYEFVQKDGLVNKLSDLSASINKTLSNKDSSIPPEIAKLLEQTNGQLNRIISEFKPLNQMGNNNADANINNLKGNEQNSNITKSTEQNNLVKVNEQNSNSLKSNEQVNQLAKEQNNNLIRVNEQNISLNKSAEQSSNSSKLMEENNNLIKLNEQNSNITKSNEQNNIQQKSANSNLMDLQNLNGKEFLNKIVKFLNELQSKPLLIDESGTGQNLIESLEELYANKDVLPKDITSNLEKSIQHLKGQNILVQPDTSTFSQAIVQLPSLVPFSKNPVYLKIQTKNSDGKSTIDPNDYRIAFLFQLETLGDLIIKIHVLDNQMFLQILNNNPITKELLKEYEPSFIQFINEKGFKTSGFTFHPIEENEQKEFSISTSSYKGVDIRL